MINRYQKVEGHTDLMRDKSSGAILNTNRNEIARARAAKEARKQEQQKIESLAQDVESIKQDFKEIKQLLARLVEDKDG